MMNKQINWNLFLIVIPSNRKKNKDWQHFKTSHPPLLAHVRKTCVSTRFGKALPIAIVRENESKLPLFWALQRATLPSQSKNIPHFPLHPGGRRTKKNEREYFGLFLFGLNSSVVHPPLLPCVCFLDAKVAEVQCLPAILTLRQTAGFPRPVNECWRCGVEASARVMRSTWPADVIGGFRDTGVKGWHGAL